MYQLKVHIHNLEYLWTRCAGFYYQDKDLHNSSQSENFISSKEWGKERQNNSENNSILNNIHEI